MFSRNHSLQIRWVTAHHRVRDVEHQRQCEETAKCVRRNRGATSQWRRPLALVLAVIASHPWNGAPFQHWIDRRCKLAVCWCRANFPDRATAVQIVPRCEEIDPRYYVTDLSTLANMAEVFGAFIVVGGLVFAVIQMHHYREQRERRVPSSCCVRFTTPNFRDLCERFSRCPRE